MRDNCTHSYIGRRPACGCVVAAVVDDHEDSKFTAEALHEFIAQGLVIEHVPHQYVRENFTTCEHDDQGRLVPQQLSMLDGGVL